VLDNFNRANGAIGSNWAGTASGYSIVSNQMDVGAGDAVFWQASSFGANQEVFITLATLDPAGAEQDLLLKSQSANTWSNGALEVYYDAASHRAQVWTYTSAQGWVQRGADLAVTLANGDRFGARARSNGAVEVYRNGVLLGTRDVTAWPLYANGGYIGLWFADAANSVLDDFGGGTWSGPAPTATPTNTPIPPTSTPTLGPSPTPTNTSVPSTATPTPSNTGFLSPSANSANSGGDNNGFEVSPANAYVLDGAFAADMNSGTNTNTSCTNAGKDKHQFYSYNFALPTGATINGIEVQLNARADSTSGSPKLCVQLSWDGGTTWTAAQSTATLSTVTTAYVLGGTANTWGRTWTATNLSNSNFRVRIINVASSTARISTWMG